MFSLVVAPHPDDAELAAFALSGAGCLPLCLSHASDERGQEAARAAKITVSELIHLDLPDDELGTAALLC